MEKVPPSIFYMHIGDAHALRGLLAMIKPDVPMAMLDLTPHSVDFEYFQGNIGHKIHLNDANMLTYIFTPRQKDIIGGRCTVGVDIAEFYNATKGIGPNDSIIIYRRYVDDGEPKVSIVHVKGSNKNNSEGIVLFIKSIPSVDSSDKWYDETVEPNIKIHPKDFGVICGFTNTMNCSYLRIDGFQNGAVMRGYHQLEDNKFSKYFGFTDEDKHLFDERDARNIIDSDEYNRMRISETKIPKKTVKSLMKFSNIALDKEKDFIKFYFLPKESVIRGGISNIGDCSVIVKNESAKL